MISHVKLCEIIEVISGNFYSQANLQDCQAVTLVNFNFLTSVTYFSCLGQQPIYVFS